MFQSSYSRSSYPEMFYKTDVLKNFAKFTGKHLCQTLFFSKVTLLKKRLWYRCFPVSFAKFLRTAFSTNTSGGCACYSSEQLWIKHLPGKVSQNSRGNILVLSWTKILLQLLAWESFYNDISEHFKVTSSGSLLEYQKQSPRSVLKNFVKFTGKHLC